MCIVAKAQQRWLSYGFLHYFNRSSPTHVKMQQCEQFGLMRARK